MTDSPKTSSIANYWRAFYSRGITAAPSEPSPFALWVDQELERDVAIVEVGCGNGRDARFFAEQGRQVMALDQSVEAIALVTKSSAEVGPGRIHAMPIAVEDLTGSARSEDVRGILGARSIAVYARFLLHAITEYEQEAFLDWLSQFLKSGEVCFLEYRAADLLEDQYEFGSHYRRPVTTRNLAGASKSRGLAVVSSDESRDFAPYRLERPLVGRTVLHLAPKSG